MTDLHRRQRRRRSLRPSWGRPLLHLPRVLRRPRSLKGSPTRVTSSRNALTARTKRYGLTSCSTGLKTQLSAACLLLRGQLTCLPSCPRWATRDGKLPAQTLRSMVPPSQIGFQSKWRQKRGAFDISTAPCCRARSRLTTRKASKKWWLNWGLTVQPGHAPCWQSDGDGRPGNVSVRPKRSVITVSQFAGPHR